MTCPQCGSGVDKVTPADGGAIEETLVDGRSGRLFRRVRPATFHACMTCEWCAEYERPKPSQSKS